MSTTPPPPPPGTPGSWPPPAPAGPPPGPAATPPPPRAAPPRPPDDGPAPIVPEGDQSLAPRVLTLWRAGALVPVALLTLPTLGLAAGLGGGAWFVPLAVVALGAVLVGLLPGMRYRRWHWRMTHRALELEHGVVVHRVRALPYFRIQHIDVEHGPLDRWLGLARLEVHTASVTATLPGLPADRAPGIRAALLQLAADAVTGEQGDDAV